jgi:hypothetical protein
MPGLMGQVGAKPIVAKPVVTTAQVVRLHHPRPLLAPDADRCPKCDSGFVTREPAFLHCRFCGNMARIASGSLLDQELYERRAGLRLAS